jgi:hypothetical protein
MEQVARRQERPKRSGQADHAADERLLELGRLGGNASRIFETFQPISSHVMMGDFDSPQSMERCKGGIARR